MKNIQWIEWNWSQSGNDDDDDDDADADPFWMNEREEYWMCAAYKWCWRTSQYEYNRCAFPLCHSYGYIGVCRSCFWFTPHIIGFDATRIEGWNPKDSNIQTYTYWSVSYSHCQPYDFHQWLLNFYITFIRSADVSTIQRKNNAIVFCLNVWNLSSSLRAIQPKHSITKIIASWQTVHRFNSTIADNMIF